MIQIQHTNYKYNFGTLSYRYIHLMLFSHQISPSWSILCTVHLLEQTPKSGKLWLYHRNNQTGAEYEDAWKVKLKTILVDILVRWRQNNFLLLTIGNNLAKFLIGWFAIAVRVYTILLAITFHTIPSSVVMFWNNHFLWSWYCDKNKLNEG